MGRHECTAAVGVFATTESTPSDGEGTQDLLGLACDGNVLAAVASLHEPGGKIGHARHTSHPEPEIVVLDETPFVVLADDP